MRMNGRNKRKKSAGEDRISALPDCVIQHILSFLPSTKQAIQAGILSKRWRNQWNRLPLLLFDSTGKSDPNFSQFIDQTLLLHDCSKIKKFQIKYDECLGSDVQIVPKLRFVTRKHVEELILHSYEKKQPRRNRRLPEFLFCNDSLVKLELKCCISEKQRANWPNLKELRLDCFYLEDLTLENILDGCPLLELLEIDYSGCRSCYMPDIASNSLKKLSFIDTRAFSSDSYVKIVCPNLEELRLKISQNWCNRYCSMSDDTIKDVLSNSPFLHTLEVSGIHSRYWLVFASQSLKKLVLGGIDMFAGIKISCPCLEEFKWCPFKLPSEEVIDRKNLAVKILRQLQHVKSLEIGGWLIQTLKVKNSSSLLLNCECLTLEVNDFDRYLPRIVSVISCSPLLEKLVIKFRPNKCENALASQGSNDCRKTNSSNSDSVVFNCSVSDLKTVAIIGLSEIGGSCKLVFDFVEFLLKNGRKLEKMVFKLGECRKRFIYDVSKKLLSLPKCSSSTNIELL